MSGKNRGKKLSRLFNFRDVALFYYPHQFYFIHLAAFGKNKLKKPGEIAA